LPEPSETHISKNAGKNMPIIHFPFGETFLPLDLPRNADFFEPVYIPPVEDELFAVRNALTKPIGSKTLKELKRGKTTAAIVINDITRPAPTEAMLTAIIEEITPEIPQEKIILVVAVGNHEMPTDAELQQMTGKWYGKVSIVSHDCYDDTLLSFVGTTTRGMDVFVNKHYVDASLKILTGLITPHQSAGFSGGRKSVVPGIAGFKTLTTHHSFPIRPADPVMGMIKNNSFHEQAVEAAKIAGVDFIINVIKNYKGQVVDVVAGNLEAAHMAGVEACEKSWIRKINKPYDVLIVSPGGYPKDVDLHQAQKAVAVAEQVTKPGGIIILVAECRKGIGKFGEVLQRAANVDEVISAFVKDGFSADHSSKAYMFARAAKKHKLFIVTTGFPVNILNNMFMTGFTSLTEAANAAILSFNEPSILCIPYAGECIPVLE
jgi:nickel-dependent lactate racemase